MVANMMLKRGLSMSATVLQQFFEVPVQVYDNVGRYASALYIAADKQKSLDTVDKDLQKIKDLYQTSKDFKEFVLDPTLAHKKRDGVLAIAKKINVSNAAANLLAVLAENGCLNKLESAIYAFEAIMRAHKAELFVKVTSAVPLSKKHESVLSDALQKFATEEQKVHVTFDTKPSIIGGFVITIDDKHVDLSIVSHVKKHTDFYTFNETDKHLPMPYKDLEISIPDINENDLTNIGNMCEIPHLSNTVFSTPAYPVIGTDYSLNARLFVPLKFQLANEPDSKVIYVWCLVNTCSPYTCLTVKTLEVFLGDGNVDEKSYYHFTIQEPNNSIQCQVSKVGSNFEYVNILGMDAMKKLNLTFDINWHRSVKLFKR